MKKLLVSLPSTTITDEEEALFGLPADTAHDEEMQEVDLDGEILGDDVDP